MSARGRRRVHGAGMAFWAPQMLLWLLMPTGWLVKYLVVVSIYANFVGHWSGFSAETPVEQEA